MTTAKDILIAARALIAEPKRWTQHAYARAAKDLVAGRTGMPTVHFGSPRAVCWCSYGAINRAGYGSDMEEKLVDTRLGAEITIAKQALARAMGGTDQFEPDRVSEMNLCAIAKFNDAEGRTPAEVLAAFDKAIEELS